MIIENSGVTIDLIPFKLYINVRDNCIKIIELIGDKIAALRELFIQNDD
jgi:hypothetical protein